MPRPSAARRRTSRRATHIHSHNLVFESGRMPVVPPSTPAEASAEDRARTFMGYRRADGRAGTRNFVGIIASVNCSTTVCRSIAERANRELLPQYSGIDGFVPIVHDQGCGMSGTGDGMQILHRTLAGYARHPNFGGMLMVGLGCEVNQLTLYGQKGIAAGKRHFNIQEAGGSRKSVEKAMGVLREICRGGRQSAARADPGQRDRRRPAMRRLGRHVRHHRQSGAGRGGRHSRCRRAAPASCRKRPRSTAPSICSPPAPPRPRSPRSSTV